MLLPAQAMAGVEISLPLGGYWRPGRYMPVRVVAREAENSVEIGGGGVVPGRLTLREGRGDWGVDGAGGGKRSRVVLVLLQLIYPLRRGFFRGRPSCRFSFRRSIR